MSDVALVQQLVTRYEALRQEIKKVIVGHAELIDKEISNLIETQYKRAIDLLETNKEKLTELANVLLAKEVIFKDNLEVIFGKRPFEKSISEIVKDPKEDKQAPQAEQENGDITS